MRHLRSVATVTGALGTAAAVLALAPPSLAASNVARLWHPTQIALPKNAASNPVAELNAVACVTAKDCVAGGRYDTSSGLRLATVAPEFGTWARAHTLAMPKNVDTANPDSSVSSLACPASRLCVAVGTYFDSSGQEQAFAAMQAHGKWQRAQEISPPANIATGGLAQLNGVSCVSVGNCVAVGDYKSNAGFAMLAVREASGHWKRAFELRNPPSSGPQANPAPFSVSCWAPGHCTAVGSYNDKSGHQQAFAITDTGNRWAQATKITPPKNATSDTALFGVSCGRAFGCTAVGDYEDAKFVLHGMVTSHGRHGWQPAREILAPSGNETAGLNAVSCFGAGSCVAGGFAADSGGTGPTVVTETSGHWGRAARISLPANGLATSKREATLTGIACLKGTACTAAGWYFDKSDDIQSLVSSRPAR